MDALVTGAGGFVGNYLLQELLQEHAHIGATKLPKEYIRCKNCDILDMDLTKEYEVRKILELHKPAQIYHLAAQSSVALSWKDPELTVDVNLKGTLHLLNAVRAVKDYHPRILLIGSSEEYGYLREGACPVNEQETLRPANLYAVTKVCQNMIGNIYAKAYGMDVLMVRAFNHIGVGQAPTFVAADFALQIAEIEAGLRPPFMQVGNLEAKRDFSDVRDIVRAYRLLMQSGCSGETYNVGSGHAVSIRELLEILVSYSMESIVIEQDTSRMRPAEIPCIQADIRKLQAVTGWQPEFSLEETLRTMLDHNRRNFGII
ncbi:MAG: GDP-mannose 4,6-dehydratase [Oscillospiraceae bacterium]|nr:GDP-mannose 4,6-dehydratase [Oscillospiraceae bacterium]